MKKEIASTLPNYHLFFSLSSTFVHRLLYFILFQIVIYLEEVNIVAVLVSKHLDLDVARCLHVLLDQHHLEVTSFHRCQ